MSGRENDAIRAKGGKYVYAIPTPSRPWATPNSFHLDLGGPEAEKTALGSAPDDLDQTPEFDPADSEPVPDDNFDQSRTR